MHEQLPHLALRQKPPEPLRLAPTLSPRRWTRPLPPAPCFLRATPGAASRTQPLRTGLGGGRKESPMLRMGTLRCSLAEARRGA